MILSSPTVRGSGSVNAVFPSPCGSRLAVASGFDRLNGPLPRAAYAGHTLENRLALYKRGESFPFACFDDARFRINAVDFHPTEPVVVIGAGSYDGGYFFEGDLVVWNWETDVWLRPFIRPPEIVACRFEEGGTLVNVTVRPRSEDWGTRDGESIEWYDAHDEAVKRFYRLQFPYPAGKPEPAEFPLDEGSPTVPHELIYEPQAPSFIEANLASWTENERVRLRGAIWDIAWFDRQKLGFVHDECHLEVHDITSGAERKFAGVGRAIAITRTEPPVVTVVEYDPWNSKDAKTTLLAYRGEELDSIRTFPGRYSFGSAYDGRILGRLLRGKRDANQNDVVVDLESGSVAFYDLGYYDTSDYLGIEGSPTPLFLVATAPPQKTLNELDGDVARPLWTVRPSPCSELCGCYVDCTEPAVIISGIPWKDDQNRGTTETGFIARYELKSGRTEWIMATMGAASSIVHVSVSGVVVAAFVTGELRCYDAVTGVERAGGRVVIDGFPSIIYAMDVRDGVIAFGTIDGCIGTLAVDELLALGIRERIELDQRREPAA